MIPQDEAAAQSTVFPSPAECIRDAKDEPSRRGTIRLRKALTFGAAPGGKSAPGKARAPMANSLTEQIYDALLQMIIEEKYKPGDRLPSENELSDKFQVSRNTVRTAINKLNVLGFCETKHGGGTFMKAIGGDAYLNFFMPALLVDSNDLIDVMEFRRGIECQAVKLAAVRATKEDIRILSTIIEQCEKSLGDMERFAYFNTNYHAQIAKASHNKMFEKMMEIVRSIIMTKMQDFLVTQGHDIDSHFYHTVILQCIINQKPDEAALMMDKHLTLVVDRVRDYNLGVRGGGE